MPHGKITDGQILSSHTSSTSINVSNISFSTGTHNLFSSLMVNLKGQKQDSFDPMYFFPHCTVLYAPVWNCLVMQTLGLQNKGREKSGLLFSFLEVHIQPRLNLNYITSSKAIDVMCLTRHRRTDEQMKKKENQQFFVLPGCEQPLQNNDP